MGESEHVAEGFGCQYCERKFLLRIQLRMHEKAKHGRVEHYFRRNETCQEHDAATTLDGRDKPVLAQILEKATTKQQETRRPFCPSPSASTEYSSSLPVDDSKERCERKIEIATSHESSDSDIVECFMCPEQFVNLEVWSDHFKTKHLKHRYGEQYSDTIDDADVDGQKITHEEVMVESTIPEETTEYDQTGASTSVASAPPIQRRPGIPRKCLECMRSFSSVEKYRYHMAMHPEKFVYRIHYRSAWLATILKKKQQIKSSRADRVKPLEEVNHENLQTSTEEICRADPTNYQEPSANEICQASPKNHQESTAEEICQADPTNDQEPSAGTTTSELSSESGSHTNSTVTAQEADKGKQWKIKSSHVGGLKLLKEVSDENLQNSAEEIYQADPTNHHDSSARTIANELPLKRGSHTNSTATTQEGDKGDQKRPQSLDYKCECCSRQFARLVKLKSHLKLEHRVVEFQGLFRDEQRRNLVAQTDTHTHASIQSVGFTETTPNRDITEGLKADSPKTKESPKLRESWQSKLNRSLTWTRAGYRCYECNNFFKERVELLRHFYQKHLQVIESPVIDAQRYLSVQDEIHPAEKMDEEAGRNGTSCVNSKDKDWNGEPVRNLSKYFQCTLCHYKTLQAGKLTGHLTRYHKMNIETALESVETAKLSIIPGSASSRVKEKKRKICPYCSAEYNAKHLPTHIMIHTGERPFSCHLCTKKFYRKDRLKDHLRKVHTNAEIIEGQGSADKPGMSKNSEDNAPSSDSTSPESTASVASSIPNQNVNHSDIPATLILTETPEHELCDSQIASQRQIKLEPPAEETSVWQCYECWTLFEDLSALQEHILVKHGGEARSSNPHDDQKDLHPQLEEQIGPQTRSRSPSSRATNDSCQAPPTLDLYPSSHSPLEPKEIPGDGRSVGKFEATEGSVLSGDYMYTYICQLCDGHFAGEYRLEHHLKADHCLSQSYVDELVWEIMY